MQVSLCPALWVQELGRHHPHHGIAHSSWSLLQHLDATFKSRCKWRGKSCLEGVGSNPSLGANFCPTATHSLAGT